MKFRVLCAIALCICVGQLCSAYDPNIDYMIKRIKGDLQNKIHGAGEQFVEDITTITDHTPSNPYFLQLLSTALHVTLGQLTTLGQNNTKFSVSDMDYVHSINGNQTKPDYSRLLQSLDYYKVLQSTLSKQFPPERYNGIINMFYINVYPNATSEEIANTLNYLDGTNDAATKISYLDLYTFPYPDGSICPEVSQMYSKAVDKLKSMIDIKPKVFEDFASIQEKFPCNLIVAYWLETLVRVIAHFYGDESKINACTVLKEKSDDTFEDLSTAIETIFPVRLPEETLRGQLNFMEANEPNTPKDEIEKALEYLYDDVPRADC